MADRLKILLLEDTLEHIELFKLHLEMTEFSSALVHCISKLKSGKELLIKEHFDIAFLDLSLSDSSYSETIEQLESFHAFCPVVVLTSLDDRNLMLSIIKKGADDCLNKSALESVRLEQIIQYNLNRWTLSQELIREKNRLDEIIRGTRVGTWEWNLQSKQFWINTRWAEIVGYTVDELGPVSIDTLNGLLHEQDLIHSNALFKRLFEKELEYYECEVRMRHKDGHWVWVMVCGKVVAWDMSNQPLRVCGTNMDISERKTAEEKLQMAASVFTNTHEGIAITNSDGNIIDTNPTFTEITGYSKHDVLGKNPRILNSGKHPKAFYEKMWQAIAEGGFWRGEIWNRKKSGEVYAERLTISAIYDNNRQVKNYVGLFSDITTMKRQQRDLELLAHYDILTQLPNRSLFNDLFQQAIAHCKRTNKQLAVCFLDLDNFKPVNDNFGHDVGDKLLIDVSKRIQACIREEDTLSRQGGDEFTLLLNNLSSRFDCEETLKRILFMISQPYNIKDEAYSISASIGVTLHPNDDGDLDTLLRHADNAMYQAKLQGKNQFKIFDKDHDQSMAQKKKELDEIEDALLDNQLVLFYQPKVNMRTGKVFGAEALLRWAPPEKELLPPMSFLPLLTGTELECKVGDWVIDQAFKQLNEWLNQGIYLQLSINISSRHLLSDSFLAKLSQNLASYPALDSKQLQLEILESSALEDLDKTGHIISSCQNILGINIALDDFGTGYSSLAHLRYLSANTIKIDQSFVRGVLDNPNDFVIIDGVIGLAESFNREVIAEGVETKEHGLMLLAMNCNEAQGYGIAKPMPAKQFYQWFNDYQPYKEWRLYVERKLSAKENKNQLFLLGIERWLSQIIANTLSAREDVHYWPHLEIENCFCCLWIKRVNFEQQISEEALKLANQLHQTVHSIARQVKLQHQKGKITEARQGLALLETNLEKMTYILEHGQVKANGC